MNPFGTGNLIWPIPYTIRVHPTNLRGMRFHGPSKQFGGSPNNFELTETIFDKMISFAPIICGHSYVSQSEKVAAIEQKVLVPVFRCYLWLCNVLKNFTFSVKTIAGRWIMGKWPMGHATSHTAGHIELCLLFEVRLFNWVQRCPVTVNFHVRSLVSRNLEVLWCTFLSNWFSPIPHFNRYPVPVIGQPPHCVRLPSLSRGMKVCDPERSRFVRMACLVHLKLCVAQIMTTKETFSLLRNLMCCLLKVSAKQVLFKVPLRSFGTLKVFLQSFEAHRSSNELTHRVSTCPYASVVWLSAVNAAIPRTLAEHSIYFWMRRDNAWTHRSNRSLNRASYSWVQIYAERGRWCTPKMPLSIWSRLVDSTEPVQFRSLGPLLNLRPLWENCYHLLLRWCIYSGVPSKREWYLPWPETSLSRIYNMGSFWRFPTIRLHLSEVSIWWGYSGEAELDMTKISCPKYGYASGGTVTSVRYANTVTNSEMILINPPFPYCSYLFVRSVAP